MKKIKIISLLLSLVMMLGVCAGFVGCDNNPPVDDTTDTDGTTAPLDLKLLASAVASYTIIRPDTVSETLLTAIQGFNNQMRSIFGNTLQFKTDFYKENVPVFAIVDTEILIGNTNRKESVEFLSGINRDDYGYKLIGTKLVIAGHTDEGTVAALEKFATEILSNLSEGQTFGENDVFYATENDFLSVSSYPVKNLLIGNVNVKDYRIVYPHKCERGEDIGADMLADKIADICGVVVDVVSDKTERGEQAHEILIGATNRSSDSELTSAIDGVAANVGVVVSGEKDILIHASGATALLTAVNGLIGKLPSEKTDSYTLTLDAKSQYSYDDKLLSAMSFNVQVWGTSTERDARVKEMLEIYNPDTIGFQEVDTDWLGKLNAFLKSEYAFVGLGRDGGTKGEFNPIFYKKDLFKCIEYGTKWLSDTPDEKSKYPESSLNRIYTYALLERKSDGQRIMVINTHFDHESGVAREKQAVALMRYINTITDYPVVLTGDFNCGASSKAYSNIVSSGMLTNSSTIAGNVITKGPTYTDYGTSNSTIDFVFVTHKKILVESYRVCNEKINGNYPSDHHPVLIEYTIY